MSTSNSLLIPVDTSTWTLTASTPSEPVMDFETKRPKADRNGEPLNSLQVIALSTGDEGGAQLLTVKFPGIPPAGLRSGVPIQLTGLVANAWEMKGKTGVSFSAAKVEVVNGHAGHGAKGGGAA